MSHKHELGTFLTGQNAAQSFSGDYITEIAYACVADKHTVAITFSRPLTSELTLLCFQTWHPDKTTLRLVPTPGLSGGKRTVTTLLAAPGRKFSVAAQLLAPPAALRHPAALLGSCKEDCENFRSALDNWRDWVGFLDDETKGDKTVAAIIATLRIAKIEDLAKILEPLLANIAYKCHLDLEDVNDCAQDVLLEIWAGKPAVDLRNPGAIGYVLQRIKWKVQDIFRRRRRERNGIVGDLPEQCPGALDAGALDAGALDAGAAASNTAFIRTWFDINLDQDANVLYLRHMAGLTGEKTARYLGLSEAETHRSKERALARLRVDLTDYSNYSFHFPEFYCNFSRDWVRDNATTPEGAVLKAVHVAKRTLHDLAQDLNLSLNEVKKLYDSAKAALLSALDQHTRASIPYALGAELKEYLTDG